MAAPAPAPAPAPVPASAPPPRSTGGEEREREGGKGKGQKSRTSFNATTRNKCWENAALLEGRNSDRWRKDPAGNIVCRKLSNCTGCLCYEYDHKFPNSKGGESTADNCQILQTPVNRSKGNKVGLNEADLRGLSCDIKFTDKELDIIEMAVYGDVIGNGCRCYTVAEMLGQRKLKDKIAPCKLPK